MKSNDIIEKVRDAYSAKSPDVLQSLRFDKVEMIAAEDVPVRKRYFTAAAVYAAACIVLVIAIPFIIGGRNEEPVNPNPGVYPGTTHAVETVDMETLVNDTENIATETLADDPINGDEYYFVNADFAGDEFRFLHYGEFAENGEDMYIWYDDYNGTAIADAVVERNRLAAEKYNVQIVAEAVSSPATVAESRMKAGQCDFDVILEKGTVAAVDALDGFYYDFRELEDEGLNLDRSYWMPESVDDLTVAGQMYLAAGYITMDPMDNARILFFNRELMNELDYNTPYEYVHMGQWTYDTYIAMLIGAEKDLDKDGRFTTADRYSGVSMEYLLETLLDRDNPAVMNGNGTYTAVPFTEGMTNAYNAYSTMIQVVNDVWMGEGLSESEVLAGRISDFSENRALFLGGELGLRRSHLNELNYSDTDYGIAPNPVAFAGDEYVTRVDPDSYMLAIPIQIEDPYMASAVLDYLAYESEINLFPAYVEGKFKTMSYADSRDYAMLDIIRGSIRYDWTDIYMPGSTVAGMPMGYFSSGTFPTSEQIRELCQSEIDGVVEKFMSIDY